MTHFSNISLSESSTIGSSDQERTSTSKILYHNLIDKDDKEEQIKVIYEGGGSGWFLRTGISCLHNKVQVITFLIKCDLSIKGFIIEQK